MVMTFAGVGLVMAGWGCGGACIRTVLALALAFAVGMVALVSWLMGSGWAFATGLAAGAWFCVFQRLFYG